MTDDPTDQLLDDYGTAWRTAQPDPPLPDHTLLHRRRPSAPLLAAGVAIAVLTAIAFVFTIPHGRRVADTAQPSDAIVPATDAQPGPLDAPAPIEPRSYPPPGACPPGSVSASLALTPESGGVTGALRLTSSSKNGCPIWIGASELTLLDAAGAPLAVHFADRGKPRDNTPYYAEPRIGPGHSATANLAWKGSWCGPVPTTLRIRGGAMINGQRELDLTARVTGDPPPCSATLPVPSHIEVAPTGVDASPPAIPADREGLRLALSASEPFSGDAATSLQVVLTLTNVTDRDISLSPCPAFYVAGGSSHVLADPTSTGPAPTAGVGYSHGGVLNCVAGPPTVPARGSVRFAINASPAFSAGTRLADLTLTAAISGAPTSPALHLTAG